MNCNRVTDQMQVEHYWNPVVEIATDAAPDVTRFATYREWSEATSYIQDSIEAVVEE